MMPLLTTPQISDMTLLHSLAPTGQTFGSNGEQIKSSSINWNMALFPFVAAPRSNWDWQSHWSSVEFMITVWTFLSCYSGVFIGCLITCVFKWHFVCPCLSPGMGGGGGRVIWVCDYMPWYPIHLKQKPGCLFHLWQQKTGLLEMYTTYDS